MRLVPIACVLAFLASAPARAQNTPTPGALPNQVIVSTATLTPGTPPATATRTQTQTPSLTGTVTSTPTRTPTPANTATNTATNTVTATVTRTGTATATRTITPTPLQTATATETLTASVTPTRAVQINIGNGTGLHGSTVPITVSLVAGGLQVAGTGNDIAFDTTVLGLTFLSDCVPNPALNRPLSSSVVSTIGNITTIRVLVVGPPLNTNPIPDGPLYTCTFSILSGAAPGATTLTNSNETAEDPNADAIASISGANGTVVVALVGGTPTATPATVRVDLGSATAGTNSAVAITATLSAAGRVLSGVANDLTYTTAALSLVGCDPPAGHQIAIESIGAFGGSTVKRVSVLGAPDYPNPLPDGAVYTCTFATAATAGTFSLSGANYAASDIAGASVLPVTGLPGSIAITAGAPSATVTSTRTIVPTAVPTPRTRVFFRTDASDFQAIQGRGAWGRSCSTPIAKLRMAPTKEGTPGAVTCVGALVACTTSATCAPQTACRAGFCKPVIPCDSAASAPTQCLAGQGCVGGACQCAGDCDGDGIVTTAELSIVTDIINGARPLSACPAADANGDTHVRSNEYTIAANNHTLGCP